jgi:SNF family Na+-dependent transporter
LLEALVANVTEVLKVSREKAGWVVGGATVVCAIIPALSSSVLKNVTINGLALFSIWDSVVVNGILPIGVLAFCLALSKKLKAKPAIGEFINDDSLVTQTLYSHWRFAIRVFTPWVITLCLMIALMASIIEHFTS